MLTACVLSAYVTLLAIAVPRHEPWFDEAQAWLLAADLGLPDLLNTVRYEGSPGLWHTLLWGCQRLGMGYAGLNYVGAAAAVAGVALMVHTAPFPAVLRVLLAFGFFPAYQYAVVARSYCLLLPLVGLVAIAWPGRVARPLWLAAALTALAQVCLHGTLLAAGVAAVHLVERLFAWWHGSAPDRRWWGAAGMFALGLAAAGWQMWPPADLNSAAPPGWNDDPDHLLDVTIDCIAGAITGEPMTSLLVLMVSAAWFHARGCLALFAVPTALLLLLFGLKHVAVWHHGTLFLAWLFALWVSFADTDRPGRRDRLRAAVVVAASVMAAVHIAWAASATAHDFARPYSGCSAAAGAVKSAGLDRLTAEAAGFSAAGVLPYFDRNFFRNYNAGGRERFFRWQRPRSLVGGLWPEEELNRCLVARPEVIVVGLKWSPDLPPCPGYREWAVFPGEMFWKLGACELDTIVILVRDDIAVPAQGG